MEETDEKCLDLRIEELEKKWKEDYVKIQSRLSEVLTNVASIRYIVMHLNNTYLLGRIEDLFNYLVASNTISKHDYADWIQEQDDLLGEKMARELNPREEC